MDVHTRRCDLHPDRRATHTSSKADGTRENRCCACNIAHGGVPADWHPACMSAEQERRVRLGIPPIHAR